MRSLIRHHTDEGIPIGEGVRCGPAKFGDAFVQSERRIHGAGVYQPLGTRADAAEKGADGNRPAQERRKLRLLDKNIEGTAEYDPSSGQRVPT